VSEFETSASYMWLSSESKWGLRILGDCSTGMIVPTIRKDGRVKMEVVGKILWKKGDVCGARIATEGEAKQLTARLNHEFNQTGHTTRPRVSIPPDDGTVPFDPPYVRKP
jgi:hypothetical protein